MIFQIDQETNQQLAVFETEKGGERFEYVLEFCKNPVCLCHKAYFTFIPLDEKGRETGEEILEFGIDFVKRVLDDKNGKDAQLTADERQCATALLAAMNEEDYEFIATQYQRYKSQRTKEAAYDEFLIQFQYEKIEKDGLLHGYSTTLPHAEKLIFQMGGTSYFLLDEYCLLPDCPCTDSFLYVYELDDDIDNEPRYAFQVNYRHKQWVPETMYPTSSQVMQRIRSAVEQHLPKLYTTLRARHLRLKNIYAHCKKRDYAPSHELEAPKVGRNDPCPCGSGKKYKKCCLRTSR